MSLLYLESLPSSVTKGDILRLICDAGRLVRDQVGRIELRGVSCVVEVPDGKESQLAKALDGSEFRGRYLVARAGGQNSRSAPDDHYGRLARLVQLESKAEAQSTLEKTRGLTGAEAEATGDCMVGLVATEEASGLGGRCIITFSKRDRSRPLSFNRFEPGAPILLTQEGIADAAGCRGVVCERGKTYLSVAFQEPPDSDERTITFRLD